VTRALRWSLRAYENLLSLYPEDLRRDYRSEMTLVFAEDLESAQREAGLRGFLRVWGCALAEFVHFELPVQASSPTVLVPAFTFVAFAALISVEMGVALRHLPTGAMVLHELRPTVTIPLFSAPFISLAVVRVSRSRIESLDLSRTTDGERV